MKAASVVVVCSMVAGTAVLAQPIPFADAVSVCEAMYGPIPGATDDGGATFGSENRVNVAFEKVGRRFICSVGRESREIEQVKTPSGISNKAEIQAILARNKTLKENRNKIASGEHQEFVKKAKRAISDKFKDPDSAKFRDVYLSNKEFPTLCGEVNAKNSYGAYVGYRGFLYNEVSMYIDDGKELGDGFMYRGMKPKYCESKFADISE